MATKPVEILIREGLKAEDFNDDVLGRTLDKLYRAGPEGIFMRIAANAYGEYSGRFLHNDTTSMSLQGEYEHEEGDIDAVPIQITHVQGPQTGPETVRYLSGHVGQLACFYTGFEWQYLGQEPFQRDCERIWAVIALPDQRGKPTQK